MFVVGQRVHHSSTELGGGSIVGLWLLRFSSHIFGFYFLATLVVEGLGREAYTDSKL